MLNQLAKHLLTGQKPKPGEPIPLEVRPLRSRGTLDFLDAVSFLMDRRFVVPGTNFRFGLNSLLLFVPVVGEIIPAIISLGILMIGLTNYKVPRVVAWRMAVNSLLDG